MGQTASTTGGPDINEVKTHCLSLKDEALKHLVHFEYNEASTILAELSEYLTNVYQQLNTAEWRSNPEHDNIILQLEQLENLCKSLENDIILAKEHENDDEFVSLFRFVKGLQAEGREIPQPMARILRNYARCSKAMAVGLQTIIPDAQPAPAGAGAGVVDAIGQYVSTVGYHWLYSSNYSGGWWHYSPEHNDAIETGYQNGNPVVVINSNGRTFNVYPSQSRQTTHGTTAHRSIKRVTSLAGLKVLGINGTRRTFPKPVLVPTAANSDADADADEDPPENQPVDPTEQTEQPAEEPEEQVAQKVDEPVAVEPEEQHTVEVPVMQLSQIEPPRSVGHPFFEPNAFRNTEEQVAEEPVEQVAVEQPAEEPEEQPVAEVQEPVEQVAEEVQVPAEQPAAEEAQQPVEQVAEEPVTGQAVVQPAAEEVQVPVEQVAEEPVAEPVAEQVAEEQPEVQEPVEEPSQSSDVAGNWFTDAMRHVANAGAEKAPGEVYSVSGTTSHSRL